MKYQLYLFPFLYVYSFTATHENISKPFGFKPWLQTASVLNINHNREGQGVLNVRVPFGNIKLTSHCYILHCTSLFVWGCLSKPELSVCSLEYSMAFSVIPEGASHLFIFVHRLADLFKKKKKRGKNGVDSFHNLPLERQTWFQLILSFSLSGSPVHLLYVGTWV